jgi:hypothetical protein
MTAIDDYVKSVKEELYGLDRNGVTGALDEIRAHLEERARESASEKGLAKPDEGIFLGVIKEFGNPYDVAREYKKGLGVKTPVLVQFLLSYLILIGIVNLSVSVFYFRDAFLEIDYFNTDYSYVWGALAVGIFYGLLALILLLFAILQFKDNRRISYLGNLTQAAAVFSIFGIVLGGILSQVVQYVWDIDLWNYPNNLVLGAIALVPIIVFLVSIHSIDRFKRLLEFKEDDPGRIVKMRKRSQVLAVSFGVVFLIVLGIIGVGFFNHSRPYEDENPPFEYSELMDTIQVRPGVTIEVWNGHGYGIDTAWKLVYTENGKVVSTGFWPSLFDAMEWLYNNSSPGDVVLSWWDYGKPLEGFTGLKSVVDEPTKDLEMTLADPTSIEEWSTDTQGIEDVSNALLAVDPSMTTTMMDKYNATFLLTSIREEFAILYAIAIGANKDPDDYIDWGNALTDLGKKTTLHKIWTGVEIPGLELVYSDLEVRILKRI